MSSTSSVGMIVAGASPLKAVRSQILIQVCVRLISGADKHPSGPDDLPAMVR
ncbi:hypothetical protein [Paenibacillus dokdonensis]|uniref:hypothetical protein n=1 Tax=Paenibacillus dokdonensis TaxID=2567944 RepID=UPI001457DE89|nr:hypothetical protein [Paenibacillus dokdonensis]